jgi:pimeloyl-ACP methyl ester carboxylesterase
MGQTGGFQDREANMKVLKWIIIGLVVLLAVALAGFTIWAYTPLGPGQEALAALQSDAAVTVETSPWLTFTPTGAAPTTGFIFYPGGRVDARSYAPAARAIAEQGYFAAIVPMPFNLAVFGSGRADDVIAAHPEITRWAVGGHSLGGAMAASYLYNKGTNDDGLVLWASYPPKNESLADRALPTTSIYGTNDGVASTTFEATRALLPPDAVFVPIEGGNHAQFGDYGPQPGDNPATISAAEQQAQAVAATVALLERLGGETS